MGKKGVIMDNGKKAQSSMALYWKNNKERAKAPKEKLEKQLEPEQDLEQRAVKGFEKWKLHKEKMITKAYTKKEDKPLANNQKSSEQEEQESPSYNLNLKEQKDIVIPGFGSKSKLQRKLSAQKVVQADQSTNILRVPAEYGNLTQEDIMDILRAKKRKQQVYKKPQIKEQQEDIILGEDLYQRKKTVAEQSEQEKPELVEQKEQNYFKSDLLNNLSKGFALNELVKKQIKPKSPEQQQITQQQKQITKDKIIEKKVGQETHIQHQKHQHIIQQPARIDKDQEKVKIKVVHSGFIPRVLRK